MASNGSSSPSPVPHRRQSAEKSALNVASRVLEATSTFAEYAERRHELLAAINDGLEDHVRIMEERAKQAVAHASAVAEASRAQETECLEYIEGLEVRIRSLQRTKRECAAELNAFRAALTTDRQGLEEELHDLHRAVAEARRQKLLAQEEQEHYDMLRDAAKQRYELAETHLENFTAKVEHRFQEAVASLQASVQERKRWADEQCALNEKRVHEASWRAEQSHFGDFPCDAPEEAVRASSVKFATPCAAVVEPTCMHQLERDVAALGASAASRLQLIVEQQNAAENRLDRPSLHITGEGCDSISALCHTSAQAVSEDENEIWKGKQRDAFDSVSTSDVICPLSASEVAVKHTLMEVCATAASASPTTSAKAPARPHESSSRAAAPLRIATATPSVSWSAPSPIPQKVLLSAPVRKSSLLESSPPQSARAVSPERRLIDDLPCSTDAFATVFTPRKC
ncbi:hypothetical protein Q4I30_006466 [Leishmania utingensis]|uniref:Uncharacterized protein n=1 Tax=Leishmania utingensis TaxID=653362 RepID=A0AAW3A4Z3_9TRYP